MRSLALLTTLYPNINDVIINHYGYLKQYALFGSKVLEIKRESEGGYSFTVKVQVVTFEHAHSNPYGTETISFNVSPLGVRLISFEHKGDEWEPKIAKFKNEILEQGTCIR
jgi:hypothetical protein